MKRRKSLLKTLLGKLRKEPAPPVVIRATPERRSLRRTVGSSIEGLEGRIAPASLISLNTIEYQDADGDAVTVKFSKNIFDGPTRSLQLAKANQVLRFSGLAGVTDSDLSTQQLQLIDLTQLATALGTGLSFSVTAVPGTTGNGFADIGAIKGNNLALGAIMIDGDLGQIDAGRSGTATGLASLTVQSLGVRGIDTQVPAGADLVSTITGALGSLKVFGDVKDARLSAVNGSGASVGKIGNITIGGSLFGRTAAEAASNNTGLIDSAGDIGAVKIGTDSTDGIFGGGGSGSGQVNAAGKIASVTVTGSIVGGAGEFSGRVDARGSMGAVKVGTTLSNGIIGGAGANSGQIVAAGALSSLTVSGSLDGDSGVSSGSVLASGNVGAVKIGGDLEGGSGEGSGRLQSGGNIASVSIGDDILAGTGANSGQISAQIVNSLTANDINGTIASAGLRSGGLVVGKLTNLTLSGSLLGGSGGQSGFVEVVGDVGTLKILRDVAGGTGVSSASIVAHGKLASVTISGNIIGGDGAGSATIVSGFNPDRVGDMGVVKLLGRVEGGVGFGSGAIISNGKLASVTLGGTATALLDVLKGGTGEFSGSITSSGGMGTVKVTGNLVGGGGASSGTLLSYDRTEITGEFAGSIGAVTITGQLRGGGGEHSGGLRADGDLKSLTVGSWNGGTGADSGSLHTGEGGIQAGKSGAIKVLNTFQAHGTPGLGSASIVIGSKLTSLAINGAASGANVHVGDALGSLSFGGDATNVTVTARGQAVQGRSVDLAIGRIDVKGSVSGSDFLAGYDPNGNAVNPDAQIGAVKVLSGWTASNLVAGVIAGADAGFGNPLDAKAPGADSAAILSKIASVQIGGIVTGTTSAGDHFGFVAQDVVSFKVAGVLQTARPEELDLVNNDVSIREIPA